MTIQKRSQRYFYVLLSLSLLFLFRVTAQLLQYFHPVGFLPPFESWHSGALPYGLLVAFQVLIIAFCALVIWGMKTGRSKPNPPKGRVCLSLGIIYFGIMVLRWIGGLSFAAEHTWFQGRIPTFFHLVLASFLIVLGRFHLQRTPNP